MESKKKLAMEVLGHPSALLGSKTLYRNCYRDNLVIFNSNICVKDGKIWWGDFDITLTEDKLVELAQILGETVYVLYEMDGRFENEDSPKLEKYVYKTDGDTFQVRESISEAGYSVSPDGTIQFCPEMIWGNKKFSTRIRLPFVGKFISKKGDICPYESFYIWLKKALGCTEKNKCIDVTKVYLLGDDSDELMFSTKLWAYEYANIPEARLDSEAAHVALGIGPSVIPRGDDYKLVWARKGYVYIEGDPFVTEEKSE